MSTSIISPLVVPAIDATASFAAVGSVANNVVTPGVGVVADPASVVELSAEAQILSAATTTAEQENAAQNVLERQDEIEQLTALSVAAQATLTEGDAIAQKTALTESETNLIDMAAMQSTLADIALSQALTATATAAVNTSSPLETELATAATAAVTASITTTEIPAATVSTTVPATTATVVPNPIEDEEEIAFMAVTQSIANPNLPITDPSVAAAIAAYHVGDGLFSEKEVRAEEAPLENDIEVPPTPKIQGSKLDLHDSARDDALHGIWHWLRVNPVQRKFTRR
ncbi:MAG TPA: hypothetical protein VK832_19425, partial [Burkholderiaceae bacterium]|nr:hypothetical protein [Burkholderiaceae bacterium]